jgi:hypothetical protein
MNEVPKCRKCGVPMTPPPAPVGNSVLDRMKFTVTGWRCVCGHFNNLKRRKKP